MISRKKGDSMMVSYVLLIVIAVAISAAVYAYLKLYVPSEGLQCSEDLSITVNSVICNRNSSILTLELSNTGLFNIDGAFIRFAAVNRTVRPQINSNSAQFIPVLAPGKPTGEKNYPIGSALVAGVIDYTLEVQPASFKNNRLVPCQNKIITQPVSCS